MKQELSYRGESRLLLLPDNRVGPLCPCKWGGARSPSNTTSLGQRPTSVPSGIRSIQPFGHNRDGLKKMGRAAVPFGWVELGPHLTQRPWAKAYLHTKWHPDSNRLGTWTEKMGRAAVPLWVGGGGSPSNTVSPGSRPTSVPSGIRSIQPFGHNRDGPK